MKKHVLMLCALAIVFVVGCGEDKNSEEAKRFDTSKNLDTGNFQAILNDPNANATDFAAAAMVAAGLDPVDLVKQLNTTASTTTGAASGDLGAVTQIPINPDSLNYLVEAENKLDTEIQAKCSGMTSITVTQECKDLYFQQTVTSLTTTVTALAQVGQSNAISGNIAGDGVNGQFDATNGISQAEATALATYLTNHPTATVNTGTADAPITKDIVTVVAGDVSTIAGSTGTDGSLALSGLGGSELQTTLESITTGTNSINPTGGTVTTSDITTYLQNNFGY